jgi:hypothetical protein
MPHCKDPHLVCARDVVDMIASCLEQDPTRPRYWGASIQAADDRRVAEEVERGSQFVGE